jgi:hypothetical protein
MVLIQGLPSLKAGRSQLLEAGEFSLVDSCWTEKRKLRDEPDECGDPCFRLAFKEERL